MKEQRRHLSLKIWWEIKQWRDIRSSTQNLKLDSNKCEEPGACYSKTRSKSCGESVYCVLSILSCPMSPPHPKKHRGCEMHLHHWHSRVVFCHLRKTESVLSTVGGNFYLSLWLVLGNRRRGWSGGQAEQLLQKQLAAVRMGDLHVQPFKISWKLFSWIQMVK